MSPAIRRLKCDDLSRHIISQVHQPASPPIDILDCLPFALDKANRHTQSDAIAFPPRARREYPAHDEDPHWSRPHCPKYDLLDVFDVPPHGHFCRFGVVALDRNQDPPVAVQRFLRAPLNL